MQYSVYLVERSGSQGGERQVTSPVEGTDLDFYDSGVWLTRETGRNFFPYEQIRTIREHADGDVSGSEGEATRNEGAPESDAERESVRDEGAEEELVE